MKMKLIGSTTLGVTAAAAMLSSSAALGDVLYDQSAYTSDYSTTHISVDQEFADFPTYSSYMADDVSFATGVTINVVSTYYTMEGNWGPGITQARLNIFAKTGSLPGAGDDPTAGIVVDVTFTNLGDAWQVTASGLGIDLAAGDYWFALTPMADFDPFGQAFHYFTAPSTLVGDQIAFRNPSGGFGVGTEWQTIADAYGGPTDANMALMVEGTVIPAPGALALLGLAGIAGRRRRRNA